MTNEEKYKAALENIMKLNPEKPGHVRAQEKEGGNYCSDDWACGNIDDAIDMGIREGRYDASAMAAEALGVTLPDDDDDDDGV